MPRVSADALHDLVVIEACQRCCCLLSSRQHDLRTGTAAAAARRANQGPGSGPAFPKQTPLPKEVLISDMFVPSPATQGARNRDTDGSSIISINPARGFDKPTS